MDFKKYIIIIIILASLSTTIREPHSKRIPTQLAVVICAAYVFPIHLEKFNHIDDEGGGFDLAFTTNNTVLTCEICSLLYLLVAHYLVRGMVCVDSWPPIFGPSLTLYTHVSTFSVTQIGILCSNNDDVTAILFLRRIIDNNAHSSKLIVSNINDGQNKQD